MEGPGSQHRKIELQAPEDLAYLLANVRRAAAARLDEAFPPVESTGAQGEDELRTRIEALVEEYITQTFTLAAPNLSINGLPVEPSQFLSPSSAGDGSSFASDPTRPDEVYEPFDARKRARVEDLTREEEDLLRDIAALKKSVPAAAAAAWAEAARRGVADDERALASMNGVVATEQRDGEDGEREEEGKGVKKLERQDDVESSYGAAVRGLGRLKREMPSVVARMERARGAGEYVVAER
ncbi:hypothetical protein F5X96DRAFT_670188 [Biscogniauxia mediterranea]|nr:hypothetical protein F5X96DRAFT_670188 [Biscogniauxia mediterranea]